MLVGTEEQEIHTQGTTGNDPFPPYAGQPWQNFPGGIGTGGEPDGSSAQVTGASGCISGRGGPGAWGNGATGGSGGGVTGLFYDGVCIAGAGGGGGGGGSGGGYNGGSTLMVAILVVTLVQDLHRHLLLHLEFWTLPMVVMVLVVDALLVVVEVVDPPVVSST